MSRSGATGIQPGIHITPDLRGRVALVTGAGVRVGRAIALGLAAAGARVAVHYNRSARPAADTVRRIEAPGGSARAFAADLRARGAAEALVGDVLAWSGRRLDVLVNSAADFQRKPLVAIDDDELDAMLALNLVAPFRLMRTAAPALARRKGLVVNILDVGAFHAWRGYAHYASAKAGLAMLTRIAALELAPRVRVAGVAPGTVAFPPDYDEAARKRVVGSIPAGRVGKPEDIAQAVLYLAAAPYVTGAVIAVDGGRIAGTRGLL